MSNLVNMQSFIRIHCKAMKTPPPKLANFYKEMYASWGQALPSGVHFFVTTGEFGFPYFYEFASHIFVKLCIFIK